MSKESAIQLISLSLVPMSGAGTSRPGPIKFFLASSTVNPRVIFSSSAYCEAKVKFKEHEIMLSRLCPFQQILITPLKTRNTIDQKIIIHIAFVAKNTLFLKFLFEIDLLETHLKVSLSNWQALGATAYIVHTKSCH